MKTLLALLLLIPSLSWEALADETITIKCEVDWAYDFKEGKEIEDYHLESRMMQITIFEPDSILIKIQYTNDSWWHGDYTPDAFYASHDDPEDKNLKYDYLVDIDRLTGQYSLKTYTHHKPTNTKNGINESGTCKKSSTLF